MLTDAPVMTLLPVTNLQRARDFYENKLGLRPRGARPDGKFVFTGAGGAAIALVAREAATKAEHTALSFLVDDIEGEIRTLERRGVVFEDYDLPGLKTVNHICQLGTERAAWFKDTEGNYLCMHEEEAAA